MRIERSKEYWIKLIGREPDGDCSVGVPNERDALWNCQQLAAYGIELTDDTGELADVFAAIHRAAAGALMSSEPGTNSANKGGEHKPKDTSHDG